MKSVNSSINFDTTYLQLPERFYSKLAPTPVSQPGPIQVNRELAGLLGIDADWLESAEGIEVVAGNRVPDGSDPIATVYAGHQFGGWSAQLGDGRAILLGEVMGKDGCRYDIQLKGSGRTPYSRGGDGRAPLGPVLREYIVSEAMAALGVPTSRALAAVTTGESVFRQGAEPGAVLARVAQSHIRIGTFQFFLARQDIEGLKLLTDYVIQRHYPEAAEAENPPLALFEAVMDAQARLIAKWQLLGFIHGVMNTDNMLLSGETIDYGPCAFMDTFDPETVFSSIDHQGRYAYLNQPAIAQWNLARLAQTLLPIMGSDVEAATQLAQESINHYPDLYQKAYREGMARKLGLSSLQPQDDDLATGLLQLMQQEKVDFTLAFRRLADLANPDSGAGVGELFEFPASFSDWLSRWKTMAQNDAVDPGQRQNDMYQVSPAIIPRNHLVAEAIDRATEGDFSPFHRLVDLLKTPSRFEADQAIYATPPQPEQVVSQTFCGT